ncbi:MAG: hypothetical protein ACYTHK_03790 [Planctomycetota bacterium]|jgi:hypothetical protein
MRFPTIAGLLMLVGCGQLGEILDGVTLSESELQAAADNYSGALVAFRELEAFAVEVSQGTVDLTGAQLVAPSPENGWVGSIYFLSDLFPGGPGELTMTFSVIGPDGPMDPALVDPATTPVVTTEFSVEFAGLTSAGANLALSADFTIVYDQSDPLADVTTINGSFLIDHDGYVADLDANSLQITSDSTTGVATNVTGSITGTMEIPDYAFDATVDVVGLGDRLSMLVKVLDQTIEDSETTLDALFGAAPEPTSTP